MRLPFGTVPRTTLQGFSHSDKEIPDALDSVIDEHFECNFTVAAKSAGAKSAHNMQNQTQVSEKVRPLLKRSEESNSVLLLCCADANGEKVCQHQNSLVVGKDPAFAVSSLLLNVLVQSDPVSEVVLRKAFRLEGKHQVFETSKNSGPGG